MIHFHNIYHQLSFSLIDAGREAGVPMVMTIHDYHWLSPNYRLFHHGQIERNWQKQSVFTTIIRNRLETFSKSVVGAIDFKIRSQKKYRQSISTFIFPTQFCFNLHNQVGWSIKQSAVISYPLPNSFGSVKFIEGKYVLFVGRLSPEKGLMTLLQVAAQTPDIPYIIMGEGQERKKIEIQIKKLRISNVTLVGYQTGADRENFLQNARIIVVPSEWFENPSLVAPEGALFQKIVLGSRIGGIPEELPGEYLIKPGNVSDWVLAITDWFNKSEVQRKSIGNSLSIISRQKHDSKKYLEKIIEVYQNSKYEKI